jgi:ribosomal protein L35
MNANHILNKKTTKRIRHLRKGGTLQNKAEAATIRVLIPYK